MIDFWGSECGHCDNGHDNSRIDVAVGLGKLSNALAGDFDVRDEVGVSAETSSARRHSSCGQQSRSKNPASPAEFPDHSLIFEHGV